MNMFISDYYPSDDFKKIVLADATMDVSTNGRISKALNDRCWIIYRIQGDLEFITSDNPVVLASYFNSSLSIFERGIMGAGEAVMYPISPHLLIAIYKPNAFYGAVNKYENRIVFLDANQESKFIKGVNECQKQQCYRQVYAQSKRVISEA